MEYPGYYRPQSPYPVGLPPKTWSSLNGNRTTGREPGGEPCENDPFYAGANGLAAFAPATITLAQTTGDPFSLLSIDLARNFAFDPAPSVTFTGTLAGGGTVSETFTVTTASPPLVFQTFDFTGFTNVTSVSWDQGNGSHGIHQFTNIHLSTAAVPEPSTLVMGGIAAPAGLGAWARRR